MIFYNLTETNQSYEIRNVSYYHWFTVKYTSFPTRFVYLLLSSNIQLLYRLHGISRNFFSQYACLRQYILQIFLRGKITLFFPCTTSIPQKYWWGLNSCPFNWLLTSLMPFISLLEALLLIFTLDRLVLNGTRRFSWDFIEKQKPSLLLSLKGKKFQSVDPSNPQGNAD